MARRNRKLFAALTRPGPHRVLRGDLGFAGIPGVVYTPASGFGLPAVAFGHDWLTEAAHYADTCEHLASWGVVTAAPDTQRGLAPSVLTLAAAVRFVRKTEDIVSTLTAVAVGLLVTLGPLALQST